MFGEVKIEDFSNEVKTINSTWACKQKSNMTLCGRLNAGEFKQIEGQHYGHASISVPVTNTMVIRIIMIIMIMAVWVVNAVGIKGDC